MSESQSRYSIVERLTSNKLELIDRKTSLDANIESYKQKIIQLKSNLEAYKTDVVEDMNRQIRNKGKEIVDFEKTLEFETNRKIQLMTAIEEKIVEIDKAMASIEKISESAPTPEQQVPKE